MKFANTIDEYVGGRVRARRIELAISEEDLAAELGTTVRGLRAWEQGKVRVPATELLEIQRMLGVDSAYLFADFAAPPPSGWGEARAPSLQSLRGSPPSLETMRLVRGFMAIRDRAVREVIIKLIQTLAAR